MAVRCSSALNAVEGMPFRWSLNPYRGCSHGCKYCYARSTHEFFGYNCDDDFERLLLAKVNVPELLERELARPGWRRELVAVGTATDPYQPIEGSLRLTARCLEVFARYRTPVSLVTKSTLVVRDAPLLAELARRAPGSRVWITITTLDRALARSVEPGAPPPQQRLRALSWLRQAGVPAGVLVAPVLPGLTDSEQGLGELVRACFEAGAVDVAVNVLRLCPGAREVYGRWLQVHYPALLGWYRRLYGARQYPGREYREWLGSVVERVKPQARPVAGRDGGARGMSMGSEVACAQKEAAMQLDFGW